MINSTTSTDRTPHANTVAVAGKPAQRAATQRPDQLSTDSDAFLRAELQRQPEIRPEVVERARALAADSNYPSLDTLKKVGAIILNTPDLSEDQS
ncbi:MAG TPA: hypothetical protein VEA63_00100 [Opitutus sp.]|nr:hypothetical protein [Opitutus sp.]